MIKVLINKKGSGEELKWESIATEELLTLASTPDMFGLPADGRGEGGGHTFVLTGALYGERGEEFVDMADALAESPHTFIFEEEKLLKVERTALEKVGAKVEEAKKVAAKEWKFDQHGIAMALGNKNKKRLWLGLMAAFSAGEKGEAVAGLMAWKARQMRDIKLSRELVRLYHDSHRGAGDLELLLERFTLRL